MELPQLYGGYWGQSCYDTLPQIYWLGIGWPTRNVKWKTFCWWMFLILIIWCKRWIFSRSEPIFISVVKLLPVFNMTSSGLWKMFTYIILVIPMFNIFHSPEGSHVVNSESLTTEIKIGSDLEKIYLLQKTSSFCLKRWLAVWLLSTAWPADCQCYQCKFSHFGCF